MGTVPVRYRQLSIFQSVFLTARNSQDPRLSVIDNEESAPKIAARCFIGIASEILFLKSKKYGSNEFHDRGLSGLVRS